MHSALFPTGSVSTLPVPLCSEKPQEREKLPGKPNPAEKIKQQDPASAQRAERLQAAGKSHDRQMPLCANCQKTEI
jgi:hypothetical protein